MQLGKRAMPWTLFVAQVIAMFSIVPWAMYADSSDAMITFLMYMGIMTLGITMGYHRYLSHRMFKCHRWFEVTMLFFAHIMMVGSAILWVATHLAHHRYTDQPRDPHSPKVHGYIYSHFLQVFTQPEVKFSVRLIRDPLYRFQHQYYWEIILAWGVLLYLLDPFSVIYAWLAPAGFAKLIGSLVFSYSHRGGKVHDDFWVGVITSGEGFHKVHHDDPKIPRWHAWDLGGQIISVINRKSEKTQS